MDIACLRSVIELDALADIHSQTAVAIWEKTQCCEARMLVAELRWSSDLRQRCWCPSEDVRGRPGFAGETSVRSPIGGSRRRPVAAARRTAIVEAG
jgi:hypothetical protein